MTTADLLTVGHADPWFRLILAHLEALLPAAPAGGEVVLYSIQEAAQVLKVDESTVRRWLRTGKKDRRGKPLKLQAYYFTSEARIPWQALQAYERGEAFDLSSLPAPRPLPVPAVPPRPQAPPGLELPMRLAS